jgi:hypothetical protein
MFTRFPALRGLLAMVSVFGVLITGSAMTSQVVSATSAGGFGTAIGNLVSGPTAQSASNSWQYFEIPDDLASATLLPNWQTSGNECVLNQNQWDNDRVNGNYPFVQFVQTRPASNLHGGNTFGANAELLIHPDNSSYRAAIGWKNTTGATVLIDYAATLRLAFPQNNRDGIAYSFQRGLSGTTRYLSLKSGTIANGTTTTTQLNGASVELQSGEMVYLTVGNKGNYNWDHTIATMSISSASPTSSAVPVITGTTRTGDTLTTSNGSWTGSPTSYAYQWKRSTTSTGEYSDVPSATSSSYVVSELDVGYFFKVSVTATNGAGTSSAATSLATAAVVDIAPTSTALPVISGTARTGATLTTSNGSWTGSPTSYAYQWSRASTVGGTYNDIASATNRTYELTNADIGKFIKVSVIANNSIGPSSAALSALTSVVVDLTDSDVPTVTTPVATATGFMFTISNFSSNYTYALTTSKGTVSRSTDEVTVTGLTAGESAIVTIAVTRTNYKPGSKTVAGSATPATTTTTTLKPVVVIDIQAPVTTVAQGQTPVTTVAQGQASVATIAPSPSQSLIPVVTTTTTTTTPATAITPRVKNAAIPTQSSVTTTIAPRVKNAAIPTAQPAAPMIPQVSTGESALDVGGVRTKVAVSRENNQIVLKSGAYQAVLSGLDTSGSTRSLDGDGNLRLVGGDVLRINMGGFKVATQVEVWMFSTPVRLGTAKVEDDGRVSGTFTIPKNIEDGSHRIAVTAKLPNGKSTTFTLGILVGNIATTSTLTRVLIAIPIALAIGFGFLLPNQLRRRRKTRVV